MPAAQLRIRLFAMDVDGTLTDGVLMLAPDGSEWKAFHARDGAGIKLLPAAGIVPAIISGRASQATARRAAELHILHVHQGVGDKRAKLESLCSSLGISMAEAAFAGDDLSDIPAMRAAGFSAAPADAAPEVRALADFVSTRPGGHGAVREAIEHLLERQGDWQRIVEGLERERAEGTA